MFTTGGKKWNLCFSFCFSQWILQMQSSNTCLSFCFYYFKNIFLSVNAVSWTLKIIDSDVHENSNSMDAIYDVFFTLFLTSVNTDFNKWNLQYDEVFFVSLCFSQWLSELTSCQDLSDMKQWLAGQHAQTRHSICFPQPFVCDRLNSHTPKGLSWSCKWEGE